MKGKQNNSQSFCLVVAASAGTIVCLFNRNQRARLKPYQYIEYLHAADASPVRRASTLTTLVPPTVSLGLPSRTNFRPMTGNRGRHWACKQPPMAWSWDRSGSRANALSSAATLAIGPSTSCCPWRTGSGDVCRLVFAPMFAKNEAPFGAFLRVVNLLACTGSHVKTIVFKTKKKSRSFWFLHGSKPEN